MDRPDRRSISSEVDVILRAISEIGDESSKIKDSLAKLGNDLHDLSFRFSQHVEAEESMIIGTLRSAFPSSDANAHREYHEALIKKEEQWARLREMYLNPCLKTIFVISFFLIFAFLVDQFSIIMFHKDLHLTRTVLEHAITPTTD